MNRSILQSCAALALCASIAGAGIVADLRTKYGTQNTIDTEVRLDIFCKIREKWESSEGHFIIASGDRFNISLGTTSWICNGQTLWQYNTANSQVVIKRLLDVTPASHPARILTHYLNDYTYTVSTPSRRSTLLTWRADTTDTDSFYRTVTVTVDSEKQVVSSIALVDKNGNESTYTFKKTRFNEPVAPQTFIFTPPEDAHVLDTRD